MERAGDLQRHDLLGPELFGHDARRGDAFGRAGDDDLTRGVEVGHPHIAVGAPAGHLDLVVVESEHRGHRSRVLDARLMHRVGSLDHQTHALVEPERAGGGQRCVFAEAVTGAEAGFEPQSFCGVEHHQAGDERRELGVARVSQFVDVGVEQQTTDIALGDVGGLVDELPALVVDPGPAHTRSLRTLAREREGKHDPDTLDRFHQRRIATSG